MDGPLDKITTLAANGCGYGGAAEELIVNYVHPLFLKDKSASSQEDNPNWRENTTRVFADNYWKEMKFKITTLEFMVSWGIVDIYVSMNIIDSTWALKFKRYPDGLIKKSKYQFATRGNQKWEGIDLFETYAPVVQWKTFWLMLILEVLLVLNSKQGEFTAEFIHANIPEDEKLYIKIPRGFEKFSKNGRKKCLELKKTLYGLCQSPRALW